MIRTDGKPTIAWSNPPEDDEHHSIKVKVVNNEHCLARAYRELYAERERGEITHDEWARAVNSLYSRIAA